MGNLAGWVKGAYFLSLLALPLATAAQGLNGGSLDTTLRLSGLRLDKAMLAGPMADAPASVRLDQSSIDGPRTEVALLGSSVMLELGRMTPDGKFQRPRLMIGHQSHDLKAWMGSVGIQAERCMLPMFRGRLKRNAEDGSVGAAVLVSARCTFY